MPGRRLLDKLVPLRARENAPRSATHAMAGPCRCLQDRLQSFPRGLSFPCANNWGTEATGCRQPRRSAAKAVGGPVILLRSARDPGAQERPMAFGHSFSDTVPPVPPFLAKGCERKTGGPALPPGHGHSMEWSGNGRNGGTAASFCCTQRKSGVPCPPIQTGRGAGTLRTTCHRTSSIRRPSSLRRSSAAPARPSCPSRNTTAVRRRTGALSAPNRVTA